MSVILKHLKTSKVDNETVKYWFGFVKRPRQAFVIYLDLMHADGHKEPFRCQVAALSSKQYEEFDKEKKSYGYFELPIPADIKPFVSFSYHARTGVLFKSKTETLNGEIGPEMEDLTDMKHALNFLKMIKDQREEL